MRLWHILSECIVACAEIYIGNIGIIFGTVNSKSQCSVGFVKNLQNFHFSFVNTGACPEIEKKRGGAHFKAKPAGPDIVKKGYARRCPVFPSKTSKEQKKGHHASRLSFIRIMTFA